MQLLSNIFKKSKFFSLSVGGTFIFIIFLLYHNTLEELLKNSIQVLANSGIKTIIILIGLFSLFLIDDIHKHLKIYPIHVLSIAMALFYLPSGSLCMTGLIIQLCLGIVLYNTTMIYNSKTGHKYLFNIGFIITGLAIFDFIFLPFFLTPISIFFDKKNRKSNYFISFLLAILSCLFITFTIYHFFEREFLIESTYNFSFRDYNGIALEEILLIAFILFSLSVSVKIFNKKRIMSSSEGYLFILLWFFIGFFISFLEGMERLNPWELTLFPLAYLFGSFLNFSSIKTLNILVLIPVLIKTGSLFF